MLKVDDNGAVRHVWEKKRLENLYVELCNYIADLTQEEYGAIDSAFVTVKSSIHQRMNEQ